MQKTSLIKFNKPLIYSLLLFVCLAPFSQLAKAQTDIPSYKIEIIIFESLALKGWTEEYWPMDIELPNTDNTLSVLSTQQRPLFINNSAKTLTTKANALSRKGYRVLMHRAWTQKAYPNKNSTQVLLEASDQYGTNMLGTVRLYKTRFAHVNFDLNFDRRIPSKVQAAFAQNQQLEATNLPTHWSFQLKESRKIRPGELHYLDHPLFGVLVQIEKLKEE